MVFLNIHQKNEKHLKAFKKENMSISICLLCSELDLTSAFEVRTRDGLVWFFDFILITKRQRFLQNLANNSKFEQ